MSGYQRVADAAPSLDVERAAYSATFREERAPLNKDSQMKLMKYLLGAVGILSCVLALFALSVVNPASVKDIEETGPLPKKALFDSLGRYVMWDFDSKKPMANFLSGLGGIWGVPLWAFYVNRGQGICSFGIQNKDGGISKFNTAEKAYQQTPFTGFRTFLKGHRKGKDFTHMPFFLTSDKSTTKPARKMIIGMNELEIEETYEAKGIQTNVLYFGVPNENFPALVRQTTFTNLDKHESLTLEVFDGLAKLVPNGLSNFALDAMGRTMEAWMNVYNLGDHGEITQPFFHISQGTADTAQVQTVKDGYFALAFESVEGLDPVLLPFIVDPSAVFGTDTTLTDPSGFFQSTFATAELLAKQPQGTTSRTPSAFAGITRKIAPGKSITIVSIYGYAPNIETYLNSYAPKLLEKGFVALKRQQAQELVNGITAKVETSTSSPIFNAYIKQSFLDNVLRGGLPITLGSSSKPKIYHVYSRIHGDIERDYNNFQIDTTYYSQGPGNFRDVNQNRRIDVLHSPAVGDFNVRMFLSFVQADGFNPLTVASTNFKVPAESLPVLVSSLGLAPTEAAALTKILQKPYRPGQLFKDIAAAGLKPSIPLQDLLDKVIDYSVQVAAGQYAQNGFWVDHWTYTLDLVDNYLSVFPDKEEQLLYDSEPVPFFMSPAVVRTRAERYSLFPSSSKPDTLVLRSFTAVSQWTDHDFPQARKDALNAIYSDPNFVADGAGAGGIWQRTKTYAVFTVSPISKLIILAAQKFSSLDPAGMGVEMEGGKPGWNDAMNGLPGLLGSGMPETYEFLRILKYVSSALSKYNRDVVFPIEFGVFLDSIYDALQTLYGPEEDPLLAFWNKANTAREVYRAATVAVFDGATVTWTAASLQNLIALMIDKTQQGIDRAVALNGGLSPTYFYYECSNFAVVISKPEYYPNSTIPLPGPAPGNKLAAGTFNTKSLPLFLEGPTRHLKVITDVEKKREVYRLTKSSALYDSALKMFFISASLADMGQDVGRMKAFSPGWLENQSIWLHMSYKFYLELLRGGLYTEFFEELKTGLVPFMDNDVYGRSPLEAASFIVSSAFPDPKLHGASFLARLSGSTAEFLSMWAILFFGNQPFFVDSAGTLSLSFHPVLPGWFFKKDDTVSSTFLGAVKVTYHNPKHLDTWTISPKYATYTPSVGGKPVSVDGGVFTAGLAEAIRSLTITEIDVFY